MTLEQYACARARASPRELRGTVLMSAFTITLAYFARVAVVRLIWRYKVRKGLPKGEAACPFPSWEVSVFITQVAGLAESGGEAVSSGCLSYEIAGGLVIALLMFTIGFFFFLCWYGLRQRSEAKWHKITWSEGWPKVRKALTPSGPGESRSWMRFVLDLYKALEGLIRRGEWEQVHSPPSHSVMQVLAWTSQLTWSSCFRRDGALRENLTWYTESSTIDGLYSHSVLAETVHNCTLPF